MPRGVDHKSAPLELRLVVDKYRQPLDEVASRGRGLEQLRESLYPAEETRELLRLELPSPRISSN